MTDKEKLIKIKKLADAMYYAAQYLTTDASRLHKDMDEYHKFIIHECKEEPLNIVIDSQISKMADKFAEREYETDGYERQWLSKGYYHGHMDANKNKPEEPVSEDLEEAALLHLLKNYDTNVIWDEDEKCVVRDFKAGANWQKEQMMVNAIEGSITRNRYTKKNILHGIDVTCDAIQKFNGGDKVKVIVIKEE